MINTSLGQISKALENISNPQDSFKSIHIVGTNGKGSVATFLELLYCNHFPQLRIAKYISPHLISVTERISINQKEISLEEFEQLKKELFSPDLTEFENITLLAFEYFKRSKVDIAILEAGLGARWDATNTTKTKNRLATVLTNVGWDHMDYLGNSLEKIRAEKEEIKKTGVPHFEGDQILKEFACSENPNSINGVNFLLAIKVFESINDIEVSEEMKLKVLTQFKPRYIGRFNYDLASRTIVDGAHNLDGAEALNAFVKKYTLANKTKIFVLAFLDKEVAKIIQALFTEVYDPKRDLIIVTQVDSSRAITANDLAVIIEENFPGASIIVQANPDKAFTSALSHQSKDDLLLITGSLYLVGAWLNYLRNVT